MRNYADLPNCKGSFELEEAESSMNEGTGPSGRRPATATVYVSIPRPFWLWMERVQVSMDPDVCIIHVDA